jgi:hypothetical protein
MVERVALVLDVIFEMEVPRLLHADFQEQEVSQTGNRR